MSGNERGGRGGKKGGLCVGAVGLHMLPRDDLSVLNSTRLSMYNCLQSGITLCRNITHKVVCGTLPCDDLSVLNSTRLSMYNCLQSGITLCRLKSCDTREVIKASESPASIH